MGKLLSLTVSNAAIALLLLGVFIPSSGNSLSDSSGAGGVAVIFGGADTCFCGGPGEFAPGSCRLLARGGGLVLGELPSAGEAFPVLSGTCRYPGLTCPCCSSSESEDELLAPGLALPFGEGFRDRGIPQGVFVPRDFLAPLDAGPPRIVGVAKFEPPAAVDASFCVLDAAAAAGPRRA